MNKKHQVLNRATPTLTWPKVSDKDGFFEGLKDNYYVFNNESLRDPSTGRIPFYAHPYLQQFFLGLFALLLTYAGWQSFTFVENDLEFAGYVIFGILALARVAPNLGGMAFLLSIPLGLFFSYDVKFSLDPFLLVPIEAFSVGLLVLFFLKVRLINKLKGGGDSYINGVIYFVSALLIGKTAFMLSGGYESIDVYYLTLTLLPIVIQESLAIGVANQKTMKGVFKPSTMRFEAGDGVSLFLLAIAMWLGDVSYLGWGVFSFYFVYVLHNSLSRSHINEILSMSIAILSILSIATILISIIAGDVWHYLTVEADPVPHMIAFGGYLAISVVGFFMPGSKYDFELEAAMPINLFIFCLGAHLLTLIALTYG